MSNYKEPSIIKGVAVLALIFITTILGIIKASEYLQNFISYIR